MISIPQDFYRHVTDSGHNFGSIYHYLFNTYFKIEQKTLSEFRHEPLGDRLHPDLSCTRYQATIVKKNTSIIKHDLLYWLNSQSLIKDLIPSFFRSLSEPEHKYFFLKNLKDIEPMVKELLIRYLIAYEDGEIKLDQEVINFVEIYYLLVVSTNTSQNNIQSVYNEVSHLSNKNIAQETNCIKQKINSFWYRYGLISKDKFLITEVIPFIKSLGEISREALIQSSPSTIYKHLPSFSLLFSLLC